MSKGDLISILTEIKRKQRKGLNKSMIERHSYDAVGGGDYRGHPVDEEKNIILDINR